MFNTLSNNHDHDLEYYIAGYNFYSGIDNDRILIFATDEKLNLLEHYNAHLVSRITIHARVQGEYAIAFKPSYINGNLRPTK